MMYTKELKRMNIKVDNSPRVVSKQGNNGNNYSANAVKMSSIKVGSGARNKIGTGSDSQTYSTTPPQMPMGKDAGNANRVVSHHQG